MQVLLRSNLLGLVVQGSTLLGVLGGQGLLVDCVKLRAGEPGGVLVVATDACRLHEL